jgi:hypothetical protein
MICTAWFDPGVAYKPDPCWRPELLAQEDSESSRVEVAANYEFEPDEAAAIRALIREEIAAARDQIADLGASIEELEGLIKMVFKVQETRPSTDDADPGIPARALKHGSIK